MSKRLHDHAEIALSEGVDLKNRILFIDREIDYEDSQEMLRGIWLLDLASLDPMTVIISSPGGSVYDGLGIYDALRSTRCEVTTIAYGLAASMASILFLAGDKRIIAPNAKFMVHSIHSWMQGSSKDIKIEAEEITELENRMSIIYEQRTNKDRAFWKKFDRSKYFTSEECIKLGVATGVLLVKGQDGE